MNIPVKRLKEVGDIVAEVLALIWNEEVIKNKKIAVELKVADITPLHKKLETCKVPIRAETDGHDLDLQQTPTGAG